MTSYIPPTSDLETFNPAIFNEGNLEGITLQEADARYLKKSGGQMTGGLGTPSISLAGSDLQNVLLAAKQDNLTEGDNIQITEANVISSTDTIYAAEDNGGLVLSETNEFSLDFTNLDDDITIPRKIICENTIKANILEYVDTNDTTVINVQDALDAKQDNLTPGNGIDISGTTISFDGTSITSNINITSANGSITTTGDITAGSSLKFTDPGDVIQDVEENFTTLTGEIQTLTTAVGEKQNELTSSNRLNPGFIDASDGETSYTISNTEFGALHGVTGNIQDQIDTKQATLSSSNKLHPNFIDAQDDDGVSVTISKSELGCLNSAESNIQDQIDTKQTTLSSSNKLDPNFITAEVLASDGDGELGALPGTESVAISALELGALSGANSNIQDQIDTKENLITVTSPLVKAGSGETSLSINHTSSVTENSADLITSGGVFTGLSDKQDTLTPGDNINIANDGTISADNTDTVCTAATNGGLFKSSSDELSLDFNNLNAGLTLPQPLTIQINANPQFVVKARTTGGTADAQIKMIGKRNGSSTSDHTQLIFQNDDDGVINTLGMIAGRVQNPGSNIGGMAFSNYSDGSTQTRALTMNYQGNWNFGEDFQNSYKLQITGNANTTGSSYIRGGLVLDPVNMGSTRFSVLDNNDDPYTDEVTEAASRENIYIKFAPSSTVRNDWAYLRQIGSDNQGHMALDFHDDANDCKFSFRNVVSAGTVSETPVPVFDVFSTGVTAHTAVYRIPQQIFYNFDKESITGSTYPGDATRFGRDGRFNTLVSERSTGGSFCSHSNGIVTFNANGYYKIRVSANNQNLTYNDRTAFAVYLYVGSTSYFEDENYNFFGWTYTRNTGDGANGNITFEDCIYIASGRALQVRTKVDLNNRNFDDVLTSDRQMNCHCNLQIERIAETDITA